MSAVPGPFGTILGEQGISAPTLPPVPGALGTAAGGELNLPPSAVGTYGGDTGDQSWTAQAAPIVHDLLVGLLAVGLVYVGASALVRGNE